MYLVDKQKIEKYVYLKNKFFMKGRGSGGLLVFVGRDINSEKYPIEVDIMATVGDVLELYEKSKQSFKWIFYLAGNETQ